MSPTSSRKLFLIGTMILTGLVIQMITYQLIALASFLEQILCHGDLKDNLLLIAIVHKMSIVSKPTPLLSWFG